MKNIPNGIRLSTYKVVLLGEDYKRVPDNISERPSITGHEFTGVIMEVGNHLKDRFQPGEEFIPWPTMRLSSGCSAGYSYEYFGGNATCCITPKIAIDLGYVLPYQGNYFTNASLSKPMSCTTGACYVIYHTKQYVYERFMGIKEQGKLALMDYTGPVGIGAIDYAVNRPISSGLIVVTDIGEQRLGRMCTLIPEGTAEKQGKTLTYINTRDIDTASELRKPNKGVSFDDVLISTAVPALPKQVGVVLGNDGCLSFFVGPTDKQFVVPSNFYNVHYEGTRIAGASGGSTQDMLEYLTLPAENRLNPSYMITHIGESQAAPETILNLSNIPGGKRLIYPHIDLSLTAIGNFRNRQSENPLFKTLANICERNHNVWYEEAETYLPEYYQI